jgi:molecular chaperone GrpE
MSDETKQAPVSNDDTSGQSEITKERDEYLNGWRRAQADFVNYKKEESKRFEELVAFATADMVRDLLPALDSFELGLATLEKGSSAHKGMTMVKGQLQDILKRRGVEKMQISKGDVFDPNFHEAMMEVDAPPGEEGLSGKILEELTAGYVVKGRVIRAAKVKLAK